MSTELLSNRLALKLKQKIDEIPLSTKRTGSMVCSVLSAVAIPVLVYIALLCTTESRLIEIPKKDKPKAALGAWIAAGMYVATFYFCYNFLQKTSNTPSASVTGYENIRQ
jgi:hypothetical protein